jgi:hypothetical protein
MGEQACQHRGWYRGLTGEGRANEATEGRSMKGRKIPPVIPLAPPHISPDDVIPDPKLDERKLANLFCTLNTHRRAIEKGDIALALAMTEVCKRNSLDRPEWLKQKLAQWASDDPGQFAKKVKRGIRVFEYLEARANYNTAVELLRYRGKHLQSEGATTDRYGIVATWLGIGAEAVEKRMTKANKFYAKESQDFSLAFLAGPIRDRIPPDRI